MYAPGSGKIEINGKDYITYFNVFKEKVVEPLRVIGKLTDFDFTLKAEGGGIVGQAEGAALGIARALIKFNPDYRTVLKANKLLTRDPREKERKKFGLKRARHAPQFSKR
jgi:small subunit ribosomal protein S9